VISLDHYNGRKVIAINDSDINGELPNGEEGEWEIVLDGDVRIICYDSLSELPDEVLVGMSLTTVVLSNDRTNLHFGRFDDQGNLVASSQMFLNPMQYGINDPAREDIEGTVRPQAESLRDLSVPPQPDERIAEGPEEPTEGSADAEEVPEHPDDE